MFHFGGTQLRVVREITKRPANAGLLQKARLVILEHILPTTEEFISLLIDAGADIFAIIAKPYSVDEQVLARLKSKGLRIIEETYAELETTDVLVQLLIEANEHSAKDEKAIVIVDVGGYFAQPLSSLGAKGKKGRIAGVIEDTTFGHNRYLRLQAQIPVPICSVARSELKEIEARFVGRDAVQAMDHVLRERGISITGRNALVIGYGMIGKNVARSLSGYDLNIYVYDLEDRQLLKAFTDGFHIHKKVFLLRHADIIFSATGSEALSGKPALQYDEIRSCKNGVILASVGSKDTEFAVADIRRNALSEEALTKYLRRYEMPMSKYVVVANNGTAVNFILSSLPIEILDLVFSEILECLLAVVRGTWKAGGSEVSMESSVLYESIESTLNEIAKAWLTSANMEAQA